MWQITRKGIQIVIILSCLHTLAFLSYMQVLADEVTDAVEKGLQSYKEGNYESAAGNFYYASQLLKEKTGLQLKEMLNNLEPLEGWKAEEATSEGAFVEGGLKAEREYTKDSSSMKVSIMVVYPLFQKMFLALSKPVMSGAGGGEITKIGSQKALVIYDDGKKSGEINIAVDGRYVFLLEGTNVRKEDMIKQAGLFDFEKLGP